MSHPKSGANARGYTYRWQLHRARYLLYHPLCAECAKHNIIKPAKVVDHIIPHRGDQDLFWDQDNWRALCKNCHNTKTARCDGGFGNPSIGFDSGCDTSGMPTDPRHPWYQASKT